jgi:cytochrome oxidase Cu insertion factor (SCO1/SenC/PrrC family)
MSTNQSAGAAWKKTVNTKNGPVEVLSITIGEQRDTAWPNTFKKEGERSPDYRLQVDTYQPKTETKETFAGDLPF